MKRYGKRWLSGALLLVLLLPCMLLACTDDTPVEDADLNFVSSHGYSVYSVVYSEDSATPAIIEAATRLRDALEIVLGCQVAMSDDHVSYGMDYAYEILVGDTNRTAGKRVLSTLEDQSYTVRVAGHKILLLGTDNRASVAAVEHFMSEILGCSGAEDASLNATLTISPDYQHDASHLAPVKENLESDPLLPIAPYIGTELLLVDLPDSPADALTLATLQGLAAVMGGEQIVLRDGAIEQILPTLTLPAPQGYGSILYETDPNGAAWTTESLLSHYASRLSGYILCAEELDDPSVFVAINLANQLNAVVVNEKNEECVKALGIPCVMDVRGTNDTWLRESAYFAKLNRQVAVEQSAMNAPALIDYAVMTGCYFTYFSGNDEYIHARSFHFLDKGAVVLGGNRELGEDATVASLSAINLSLIPAERACNLSVLSSFAGGGMPLLENADRENTESSENPEGAEGSEREAVHTVCFVMSNGQDAGYLLDEFFAADQYTSELRGKFAMNWGIGTSFADLAAPVLSHIAAERVDSDAFVFQFAGVGMTYPSHWNLAMLSQMAARLNRTMEKTGVRYLQVVDRDALDARLLTVFAQESAVEGIFYIDSKRCDAEKGIILWSGDVPIVSARYCLCAARKDGSFDRVAESINSASTDPGDPNAYSFVIIDADSGLDEDGNLVLGGNTMNAVAELVRVLDEDVRVVTASEFMDAIKKNLYRE